MRIERCEDPKCKGFGKKLVDRGYGYPVCPSNTVPLNPEHRKPMDPRYEGQYNKEVV
jgi:hypothetical protein